MLTPVAHLSAFLDDNVPSAIALHLLPFYPSDGDGGFAPSDWFAIDPRLGDLGQAAALFRQRSTIVDGIYNHVGTSHRFVREALAGVGNAAEYLHFSGPGTDVAEYPTAPRGGSVMRPHPLGAVARYFWQTFTDDAFDLNLLSPQVLAEVDRHLSWLKELGVWGVRLDAPAYYGKIKGCA